MAGKRSSEGIALLSLYKDEGDEEDDEEDEEDEEGEEKEQEHQPVQVIKHDSPHEETVVESVSLHVRIEASETLTSPFPAAPRLEDVFSRSPVADQLGNGAHGMIVDYAHDDAAVSPEAEEGEITSMGRAVFGLGLKSSNGATPPSTRSTVRMELDEHFLQTPGQEQAATTPTAIESLDVEMNDSTVVDNCRSDDDALADFLPPPPTEKCSQDLQNKFARYLALKEAGRSFNDELRKSKGYRNPDFLQRAVMYQEIDQIGSCFKKEIFDPHGYDPSDFYDALALEFKREQERKEQAKKQSQRLDFMQGGIQAPSGSMLPDKAKPVLPAPSEQKGSSISASVDTSVAGSQVASESAPKADSARSNKKSKWDKVDDARVPPLPSTVAKPALAANTAHAAFAVASAGGGYASFAQQKRKEAEERSKWER